MLIVISLFSEENTENKIKRADSRQNQTVTDLIPGILFSVEQSGQGKFNLAYLTKDKSIFFSSFRTENNIVSYKGIGNSNKIFQYEKEDDVVFLNIFSYSGRVFITHLEKLSYEIIMNYFSNTDEIGKIKLGDSDMAPFLFKTDDGLSVFYNDIRQNTLINKKYDLLKMKYSETAGRKDTDGFAIYHDESSGNFLSLWKTKNELKNIYLSPMNNDLNGLSNMILLKFKQKTEIPLGAITDKDIELVFQKEFQNSYMKFPILSDVRNHEPGVLPEIFNEYKINYFYSSKEAKFIFFTKSIFENDRKYDDLRIGMFDPEFNFIGEIHIAGIKGTVSNIRCYTEGKKLYAFWIENLVSDNVIRCSVVEYE